MMRAASRKEAEGRRDADRAEEGNGISQIFQRAGKILAGYDPQYTRQPHATRNVIEHNGGIVNAEFVKLIPGSFYKLGDRVVISTPELGDAI